MVICPGGHDPPLLLVDPQFHALTTYHATLSEAIYDITEQETSHSCNMYHKIVPGLILQEIILL